MRKLSLIHLVILLCLSVFVYFTHSLISQKDGLLKIHFFDVGQGDAVLIKTPSGRQILVDGGPDRSVLSRLGEAMPFYDRTLDLVVLTHPDADHLGGLIEVLKNYRVRAILETGMACDTGWCQEWEQLKKEEGAQIILGQLGQELDFRDGSRFLVLHPLESVVGQSFSQRNTAALVIKMTFGAQSVLLPADIEEIVEEKLEILGLNLDADFLKIAHHGSRTSSGEEFLKAVSPLAAFISVGQKNSYGHPAGETMARLNNLAIPFFRTDQDGTIELVLKGENGDYEIRTNQD